LTQVRILCKDRSVVASVRPADIPRAHHKRWPGGVGDQESIVVTAGDDLARKYLRRVQVTRKRPDGSTDTAWEMQPDKNRIIRLLDVAE